MNIHQLRQSVKTKWLRYYKQNRSWLVKIRVWGTYNGLRRPSSGFILATLSVLEPQFDQLISFVLDLNDNPDEIVSALGLNFNPDQELTLTQSEYSTTTTDVESQSLHEQSTQSKTPPLVAVASQISDAKTLHCEKLYTELPHSNKTLSSSPKKSGSIDKHNLIPLLPVTTHIPPCSYPKTFTFHASESHQPLFPHTRNSKNIPRQKVPSSVALATQVASRPSTKMSHSPKPPSALPPQHEPSPLANTINMRKAKNIPAPKPRDWRFYHLPIKFWSLLLQTNCLTGILFLCQCLKSPFPGNDNIGKISPQGKDSYRQLQPLTTKNGSSLASWVDEFCQGREYDPETNSL
ncbi:DUF5331 domain-containing protein [Umezakia ovalisporum]|jgi:hypothetical protein|uniref:DUF5331 domain-containing protein n=2 Tax=Umezakia ovalisporum TaxID=75695 RepID=A0AA43GWP3_9CYAN|nr:DUF5331 domain-containing protein [Umezakia ovalisporum]MDH6055292.1 DUF5331 domain-containing protein [Umezakia ovalisporum FSS-43]MDH6062597.1 DUF5331 domain-containing protein [Umezakia ovalisporum FSS-62]MDH6066385.1 DUF5331 domain-containing protein [Umezakia ovalisporum APH033B]MDH6071227.1 DUF5331 domain-containing protein [Umezakia ovalisporum CobakiLakeA]MDH6073769.1 DUF5331 domain-containing protein [Umezakia ovalisporum CS-1034]